ncbi:MAG: hypothetical protein CL834_00315 [Crocinitomicaceae bacterium]|nr:hypothetical protein [Crocinitomicaceae bacterium]
MSTLKVTDAVWAKDARPTANIINKRLIFFIWLILCDEFAFTTIEHAKTIGKKDTKKKGQSKNGVYN